MNTKIKYAYRDAANRKTINECVIRGAMTPKQECRIVDCLEDETYFIPFRVGLPETKNKCDSNDPWFEWFGAAPTMREPTLDILAEELVARFEGCRENWQLVKQASGDGAAPYRITIREVRERTVTVWAHNGVEAVKIADEQCEDGKIIFDKDDLVSRECSCKDHN